MDLTFFLQGVTAWELIRTGLVSALVFWGFHKMIIRRDFQQILDSQSEMKTDISDMKTSLEQRLERELGPLKESSRIISELKGKFETLEQIIFTFLANDKK